MSKNNTKDTTFDVAIIGGGLAGLTMAAILGREKFKVVCIDREDPKKTLKADFDGRTTAISFGSKSVLERAGIWNDLYPNGCPIKDIHITDNGSSVLLEFLSQDVSSEAFGWIFQNLDIRKRLIEAVQNLDAVKYMAPAELENFSVNENNVFIQMADGIQLKTKLIIGADGRNSFVRKKSGISARQWSYDQRAIICNVLHENSHDHIAVEDFRDEGPFAILPMVDTQDGKHRSSVVWTEHGDEKDSAIHWDTKSFNAGLNTRFPARYGAVEAHTSPMSYPLGLIHARSYIGHRVALISDAAHGIHPIAGQGLNLGYRDVDVLSDLLIKARDEKQDLGQTDLLKEYQKMRRLDVVSMTGTTDLLNRLFSNKITPVRAIRKFGLRAVQKIKPARKFFMRQAMGERNF